MMMVREEPITRPNLGEKTEFSGIDSPIPRYPHPEPSTSISEDDINSILEALDPLSFPRKRKPVEAIKQDNSPKSFREDLLSQLTDPNLGLTTLEAKRTGDNSTNPHNNLGHNLPPPILDKDNQHRKNTPTLNVTRREFIPLDLASLPERLEPPNFSKLPDQVIQYMEDQYQETKLIRNTGLLDSIHVAMENLTKVPLSVVSEDLNSKWSLKKVFEARGQLIANVIQEIECSECSYHERWPIHCFQLMDLHDEIFECSLCHESQDLPLHCGRLMEKTITNNLVPELIRAAERKKQEFDFKFALNLYTTAIQEIRDQDTIEFNENDILHIELERAYCLLRMNKIRDAELLLYEITTTAKDQANNELLAISTLHLIELYLNLGELDKVGKHLEQAQAHIDELEIDQLLAKFNLLQGIFNRLIGKYQPSLTNLLHAKKYFEKNFDEVLFTQVLLQLGLTTKELGDYSASVSFLTLATMNNPEFDYQTAANLYYQLFTIALTQDDHDSVLQRYDDLRMLYLNYKSDKDIEIKFKFAETLMQKSSPRMAEKSKALETLQKMLEDHSYMNFEQHIFLMVNIADLLLQELQAFESDIVLQELEKLIIRLKSISKSEGSLTIFFQSSILQAKLKLVNYDFNEAYQLLEELEQYTQDHNLFTEEKQVIRLRREMNDMMNKMDTVSFKNQSLRQRLMETDLHMYIEMARNHIKDKN